MKPDHDFVAPPIVPGTLVHWFEGHGTKPAPAVVVEVGERNLHLAVFVPSSINVLPQHEVYHVSDPASHDLERARNGCWDYIPDSLPAQLRGLRMLSERQDKINRELHDRLVALERDCHEGLPCNEGHVHHALGVGPRNDAEAPPPAEDSAEIPTKLSDVTEKPRKGKK